MPTVTGMPGRTPPAASRGAAAHFARDLLRWHGDKRHGCSPGVRWLCRFIAFLSLAAVSRLLFINCKVEGCEGQVR